MSTPKSQRSLKGLPPLKGQLVETFRVDGRTYAQAVRVEQRLRVFAFDQVESSLAMGVEVARMQVRAAQEAIYVQHARNSVTKEDATARRLATLDRLKSANEALGKIEAEDAKP